MGYNVLNCPFRQSISQSRLFFDHGNSSNMSIRNSRNVVHVVHCDIMCRYTLLQKIHLAVIFWDFVPFKIKILANVKYTTVQKLIKETSLNE